MRFTEFGREEEEEGGDTGDLGRKRRVKRGRLIKTVITLLSKNGC